MRKLTLLAATAIATTLAASPVLAQDYRSDGQAQFNKQNHRTMKVQKPGKQAKAKPWRDDRAADMSYERGFDRGYNRGYERRTDSDPNRTAYQQTYVYDRGYPDSGFWPADVAANVVTGAVTTAGAVASAPFRDTYAYDPAYDDNYTPAPVYRSTYNDGWNGAWNANWNDNWAGQSYAQRNGFVCTPGTWFTNSAGYSQLCQ